MKKNIIERLLEEKIGLDTAAIGRKVIEKAFRQRMDRCGATSLESYAEILADSRDEWKQLIEMVVVPETWFFRNRKVFDYLARFVRDSWTPENSGRILKILSIPCSTGEEPYTIAMALMDGGIQKDRFMIVGMDISEEALKKARTGFYGKGSFRGQDLTFRDRYFQPREDGYQLLNHVMDRVRFKAGNVMATHFAAGAPFDVVFCRNLMIYMSPEARNQTLETMSRLLTEKGIFFCGHAERQTAIDWGFEAVNETGVFACRKRCRESRRKETPIVAAKTQYRAPVDERKEALPQKPLKRGEAPSPMPAAQPRGFHPSVGHGGPEKNTDVFLEARAMADQGQLPEALALCRVFLSENPVHVEAHFIMGLIYEALDKVERAEAFFNRAIYLNPEHVEALNHLAFIELERGNGDKAERLRQRAQRIGRGKMGFGPKENSLSGIRNGK